MNPVDQIRTENKTLLEFRENFRDLDVVAIEQSVKVTMDKVIRDRILFMVLTHSIAYRRVEKILKSFNFPEDKLVWLEEQYYWSDAMGFSLEDDNGKLNYRIYFERSISLPEIIELDDSKVYRTKTISSLKWDFNEPSNYNSTNYYRIIEVNFNNVFSEVNKTGFTLIPKFMMNWLNRKQPFIFYVTEDENTDRRSFYTKLRNFYLKDLTPDVLALTKHNLSEVLKDLSEFKIHYFGGGISKTGEKFFNMYFLAYEKIDVYS
jgi:hypothetical protein